MCIRDSIYPGCCSTLGGPKKNVNAEVLDPAGNVIPRLYAAGSFGNFQAHSYGITCLLYTSRCV